MRLSTKSFFGAMALVATLAVSAAAQTPTLPYDHIHLNVPDQAKAVEWYANHFGGKPTTEGPERLMFRKHAADLSQKDRRNTEFWQLDRSYRLLIRRPRRQDEGARGCWCQDGRAGAMRSPAFQIWLRRRSVGHPHRGGPGSRAARPAPHSPAELRSRADVHVAGDEPWRCADQFIGQFDAVKYA